MFNLIENYTSSGDSAQARARGEANKTVVPDIEAGRINLPLLGAVYPVAANRSDDREIGIGVGS